MKRLSISVLAFSLMMSGCTIIPKSHTQTHNHHHDHSHGWDYEHPEKWGDQEVNKLCTAGQKQSPIDVKKVTRPLPDSNKIIKLDENHQAQDFSVKNNGHTIIFDVKDQNQSSISVNGINYHLLQFHYHIPSEHTVMNTNYPLEIHFVYKSNTDDLAVVGVLANLGKYNASLQQIITNLPNKKKDNTTLTNFNIGSLMPKGGGVYTYDGSLTTPPCSEKVQWLLKSEPIQADKTQLNTLSKLYNGNNRPVQPQNDREILLIN
ncbi:MAG: carbonic anhydrase family protein [Moraxella sp.]|nr:carbonic anhydrase family protein [Moraxella sp.]